MQFAFKWSSIKLIELECSFWSSELPLVPSTQDRTAFWFQVSASQSELSSFSSDHLGQPQPQGQHSPLY